MSDPLPESCAERPAERIVASPSSQPGEIQEPDGFEVPNFVSRLWRVIRPRRHPKTRRMNIAFLIGWGGFTLLCIWDGIQAVIKRDQWGYLVGMVFVGLTAGVLAGIFTMFFVTGFLTENRRLRRKRAWAVFFRILGLSVAVGIFWSMGTLLAGDKETAAVRFSFCLVVGLLVAWLASGTSHGPLTQNPDNLKESQNSVGSVKPGSTVTNGTSSQIVSLESTADRGPASQILWEDRK